MSSATPDTPLPPLPPDPDPLDPELRELPPRPGPLQSFWTTLTRYEAEKVTAWPAFRNAIGLVLPLIIGFAVGNGPGGLVAATGALNVSGADGADPYPRRARRMLLSSVVGAIAVFIGAIAGRDAMLVVALISIWGFCAGLSVALGSLAADLGVISLVTAIVFAAQPLAIKNAAFSGLLALAGGLIQTALSNLLWPVRRYYPERRVLGALYSELSRATAAPVMADAAPPASVHINQAQEFLAALGWDRSIESERYRALLNQAERIRLSILTLIRLRNRMRDEEGSEPMIEPVQHFLAVAGTLLQSIGSGLTTGTTPKYIARQVTEMQRLSEVMRRYESADADDLLVTLARDVRMQMDALGGQLRAVAGLATDATPTGLVDFEKREAAQPLMLRMRGRLAILRANLTFRSTAFRHAVRLAVCVGLAETIGFVFIPERSYWLPMTAAIILKPDFTSTFARGLLRLAGTFTGLLIATALFHFTPDAVSFHVFLIGLLTFILRWIGLGNYGIFVTALSAMVVLMISLTGVGPREVIAARGLNTTVGGVLAVVIYWLWPTWESGQISETLAQLLDAYRRYFNAVVLAYAQPETPVQAELEELRTTARLARSNLEASFDRLSAEPVNRANEINALHAILATSHRLVHAIMSMEAGLSHSDPVPVRDAFRTFAKDVDYTLEVLIGILRGAPRFRLTLPDLREDHQRLIQSGDPRRERYALSNVETDRIANSLNTLVMQVQQWLNLRPKS